MSCSSIGNVLSAVHSNEHSQPQHNNVYSVAVTTGTARGVDCGTSAGVHVSLTGTKGKLTKHKLGSDEGIVVFKPGSTLR